MSLIPNWAKIDKVEDYSIDSIIIKINIIRNKKTV